MPKIWYANTGLNFECQGCGGCCEGPGGYVWVDEEEMASMAKKLGLSDEQFSRRYVRIVFGRTALVDNEKGDCVFLKDKRCSIYEQRPVQCRTFPWWPELLRSEKAWRENNYNCPGMNRGVNHSAEEILKICEQNHKERSDGHQD